MKPQILLYTILGIFAVLGAAAGETDDLPLLPLPQIEINGVPAKMYVATSAPFSGLLDTGAKHVKLKNAGPWVDAYGGSLRVSEPARVTKAGPSFDAPFLIVHLPWWLKAMLHLTTLRLDGFVGWPEIRDNILVFDADRRVIRRVEKLPPETATWLKLKVEPVDHLLLELPLTNDEVGVVSVDLGMELHPTAVRMTAVPWKEWKTSRRQGLAVNQMNLGELALTNVTPKEMSEPDARDLLYETPAATSGWQLGAPALTRLDLVVDGRNGWAYLRARPPAKTDGAPVKGNWRIDSSVRVFRDNLLVYAAWYKWRNNDVAGANAAYNEALALNPRNADAWAGRGVLCEVAGDFSGAVSNYDHVITLRPDYSEWERLYRQTVLSRLAPSPVAAVPPAPEATAGGSALTLAPVTVYGATAGVRRWAATIHLFLDGSLSEKSLLAAAKRSDGETEVSSQEAQADYYIGLAHLARGDRAGARGWFEKCRAAGKKDDDEYYFSVAELARLDATSQ